MARLLVIVTDVFEIAGRCICVLPVVPPEQLNPGEGAGLRPGDNLELRRPNGTSLKVTLSGLGWPSPRKGGLIIQIEPSLSKNDIPLGTEIWSI